MTTNFSPKLFGKSDNCSTSTMVSTVSEVIVYHVETYTGNRENATTNASVYISIFADDGATLKRMLKKSMTNSDKFLKGHVSTT